MPSRTWKVLSAIAIWGLLCTSAPAQDGPECFSQFTKFNVCEKAREMHGLLAAQLPQKMNANITLAGAFVAGRRVIIKGSWAATRSQIAQMALENGISQKQWGELVQQATQNLVCSNAVLSAFVRLGGQMQYVYQSTDNFEIFSALVETCK